MLEFAYCMDCREMSYALPTRNGKFEQANVASNHEGHRQLVFDRAPNEYPAPICNVLTKLKAGAPVSHNEIVLFRLAIDLGGLEVEA